MNNNEPSYIGDIGGAIGQAFVLQALLTQISRKKKGELTEDLESRIRDKIKKRKR